MNSADCTVRRATIDDLEGLKSLWEQAGMPVLDLERHLTEFQVVIGPEGEVIGALGLHIQGKHGLVHNEAYLHPETEDEHRPQIWLRIQNIAKNHGLSKLWTVEESPFWHQQGFISPEEVDLKKFPDAFGDRQAHWSVLRLRDENVEVISLEKEFEIFSQSQRESTNQLLRQAAVFKYVAYVILFIACCVTAYVLVKLFRHLPGR